MAFLLLSLGRDGARPSKPRAAGGLWYIFA